ncbi:MAG TPA: YjbQ family protein, partial [Pseudonocardia sp.]|uniref:YjbQ family protein n=1 Tax=Pseudonocardia sp. TaxID=60912 RepID=UPI002C7A4DBF
MHSEEIQVRTGQREAVVDLTDSVTAFLRPHQDADGLLHAWVPHATAGLVVIETGAGSDEDLLTALRSLLPADDRWRHRHGSPGHGR